VNDTEKRSHAEPYTSTRRENDRRLVAAIVVGCSFPAASSRRTRRQLPRVFDAGSRAASGSVALLPVPSPFGIAVTVDGRTRYRLSARIAGLPEPRSLGDTRCMSHGHTRWRWTAAVKLGQCRKTAKWDLGELSPFSSDSRQRGAVAVSRERRGLLVLRGTSPSGGCLPIAICAVVGAGGVARHGANERGW